MKQSGKNLLILIGVLFGSAVLAMIMAKYQSVEDALFTAHYLSIVILALLWVASFSLTKKRDERERAGLRRSWKGEDLDELEERVRMLEERE